jgi:hypothetical protein
VFSPGHLVARLACGWHPLSGAAHFITARAVSVVPPRTAKADTASLHPVTSAPGTKNTAQVSNQVLTRRPLPTKLSLFLGVAALLLHPPLQVAQQSDGSASLKSFVGTWKGTCADGAEFVVLKLNQSGNEMAGTVSIANMNGADGQCAAVMDPPTDEHVMKIHDVQLRREGFGVQRSRTDGVRNVRHWR